MRLLIVVSACLALQLAAASSSIADEPIEKTVPAIRLTAYVDALQSDEDGRAAMLKWRSIFEQTLHLYVDRLVSDYQLGEAQRKHLDIAAKGTAERYIKRWTRTIAMRAVLMEQDGEEPVGLDPILDTEEIEEFEHVIAADTQVKWMAADPLWQHALEKALSHETLQQLRSQERAKEMSHRDQMVDNVIVWLDGLYVLSEAQRQKLRPLVHREIFDDAAVLNGHLYTQFYSLAWAYQVPAEKLQPILSESQMKLWTKRAQEYSGLIKEMDSEMQMIGRWFNPDSLTPEQLATFETK